MVFLQRGIGGVGDGKAGAVKRTVGDAGPYGEDRSALVIVGATFSRPLCTGSTSDHR